MKRRKTLKELTIKDSFMFGAVMVDEENCKGFLELAQTSREMEERYMLLLKEWIEEEREDAREEGRMEGLAEGQTKGVLAARDMILEVLSDLCDQIPAELEEHLRKETDLETLKEYFRKARKASSIEEFQEMIFK